MRLVMVLTPVALVGAFAIHQAVSGPEFSGEKTAVASEHAIPAIAAAPAVPTVPAVSKVAAIRAVPDVPAVPAIPDLEELSRLATLSEDIQIRIPSEAIERASLIAEEFRMRAEAHADVDVTLNEVMRILDDHLSNIDFASDAAFEELGLTPTFFADLAASIQASVAIDIEDGDGVIVKVPKTRRQ